jgi:hypothetical protein
LLAAIRDDLTDVCKALDVVESTRSYSERGEHLKRALLASERAVAAARGDQGLVDALNVASEAISTYREQVDRTVGDAMLFGSFLAAETRLFHDLGIDAAVVNRFVAAMQLGRRADAVPRLDDPDGRFSELAQQLTHALAVVENEQDHQDSIDVVRQSLLVVGGIFVLRLNLLIGAGSLAVTGGLSPAGAAVAEAFGVTMIDRGLPFERI